MTRSALIGLQVSEERRKERRQARRRRKPAKPE